MDLRTFLIRFARFIIPLLIVLGVVMSISTGDVEQSILSVASVSVMFIFCMLPTIALIWVPLKSINRKYQQNAELENVGQ